MFTKTLSVSATSMLLWLFMLASNTVNAGLYNPDFELGLNGWSDLSVGGSVATAAGVATLSAGADVSTSSAVLTQGDDGNFSFASPVVISESARQFEFDLWLLGNEVDVTETGSSIFSDSFTLFIFDMADASLDHIFSALAFSSASTHYSFDVSALAGRSVAFSFQLADEDNGFNLSLGLDNLKILTEEPPTAVPESNSLVLLLLSFSALVLTRFFRERKKRH